MTKNKYFDSCQQKTDEHFMRRCLQLAQCGRMGAHPNPMVGAVIVSADGRIIGEGYHRKCGEGHAEVNAFASVKPEDEKLLAQATIYVSLEPCSHYGKTPPCADLIIRKGVRRCVCGCIDPFSEVQGRGIKRIAEAGIATTVGILEEMCLRLNRRFITFNTLKRPYIILKWATTANGFMDDHGQPLAISTPKTKMLVHQQRAECDAIVVGRVTCQREHPQLNIREWSAAPAFPQRAPEVPAHKLARYVLSSHTDSDAALSDYDVVEDIPTLLDRCYSQKQQTLIVEGGRMTLQSFLDKGLWDEIRVETAPLTVADGTKAPAVPADALIVRTLDVDGNRIVTYRHNSHA